jgi:hypothetical protein
MLTQASWEARKRSSRKNLLTDEASYKCPSSSAAAHPDSGIFLLRKRVPERPKETAGRGEIKRSLRTP